MKYLHKEFELLDPDFTRKQGAMEMSSLMLLLLLMGALIVSPKGCEEGACFFDLVQSDWTKAHHREAGFGTCLVPESDAAEFESESELLRKSSSTPTGEKLLSFCLSISAVDMVINYLRQRLISE